jgi:hypothetical protein
MEWAFSERTGEGKGLMKSFYLFFLFSFLYLFTTPGHLYTIDSEVSYHTTDSLVRAGTLVIPGNEITVQDSRGRPTGRYGLLQPILCIPLYLLGALFDRNWADPPYLNETWRTVWVATFNQWVCALGLVLFYRILRALDIQRQPALAVTLALGFGSPWWTYSRDLFRQPLSGVLILWAMLEALRFRQSSRTRDLIAVGTALGFSITNRLTTAATWPGCLLLLMRRDDRRFSNRDRRIFSVVAGLIALGIGLQVGTNLWRFGTWWGPAYANRHFSLAYLRESIPEFLISPARGLLLFSPTLLLFGHGVLAGWRKDRWVTFCLLLTASLKVLLFAVYYDFRGGVNPGPRYLIPVLPILFIFPAWVAGEEWRNRSFRYSFFVLSGLGVVVNGFNSLIHYQKTLTFWDQLCRYFRIQEYEQWPPFDWRMDLSDVLLARWLIEGWYVSFAVVAGILLAGVVFASYRLWCGQAATPPTLSTPGHECVE